MHSKYFATLLCFSLSFHALSQTFVTLHTQCNYAGKQYTLVPGSYRDYEMKIPNDKLNSMQIPQGFKVTIYSDNKFQGKSKTYTDNIACLEAEFQNMASSIIVEGPYVTHPPGYGNEYVTFYNDCNSRGHSQSLRPGTYTGAQLGLLKLNISSFEITGNVRVRAYLYNENLVGSPVTFDVSQSCLSGSYSDKIGSLVVEYKPAPSNPAYPDNNQPGSNGSYATLYTDCNYSGNALRLMPGTYQGEKLGLIKYNISSIQLSSTLRARVYLDNEYLGGNSYTIENDMSCMTGNLRNRIGSLVIEERYGNSSQYPPQNNNESVIIYTDEDYKGFAAYLLPGTYSTMAKAGFTDNSLSSLILPAGYRVVLYENENFTGKSYTITQSKTGFSISGFNDRTSSISVYRN